MRFKESEDNIIYMLCVWKDRRCLSQGPLTVDCGKTRARLLRGEWPAKDFFQKSRLKMCHVRGFFYRFRTNAPVSFTPHLYAFYFTSEPFTRVCVYVYVCVRFIWLTHIYMYLFGFFSAIRQIHTNVMIYFFLFFEKTIAFKVRVFNRIGFVQ